MENYSRENKYLRAKERVEELKSFYNNLISYIFVCAGLAIINYFTYWGYKWFLWVIFGWGIGIFFHALSTFRLNPFLSKQWEQRKIKQYMEQDKEDYMSSKRWE